MTNKELLKGISVLNKSGLAVEKPLDDGNIYIWNLFFGKYTYEQFLTAIILYISNNKFFPTISDLLALIPGEDEHLPAGQIWNEYKNKHKDEIDHLILAAFKYAGISKYDLKNITMDTAHRFLRPRVEKIYRELVNKEKDKKRLANVKAINKQINYRKLEEIEQ